MGGGDGGQNETWRRLWLSPPFSLSLIGQPDTYPRTLSATSSSSRSLQRTDDPNEQLDKEVVKWNT